MLGKELPPGSRFCNKCGTPVALESPGQSRFSSPESYIPLHLAEKILTSKGALEGERKQVTVLFADLKGSTNMGGASRRARAHGQRWDVEDCSCHGSMERSRLVFSVLTLGDSGWRS